MIFLTYNDPPSGVYSSQVIDVCRFLRNNFKIPVKLVAFISIRNFFKNRRKIKQQISDTLVLPMFPKAKNWRKNRITLSLITFFLKKQPVIARGPFATAIALELKKKNKITKVCFDGRGAYSAELNEYDVVSDKKLAEEIRKIEAQAVLSSDYRIAVSEALVAYWQEGFGYNQGSHAVIPCTFSSAQKIDFPAEQVLKTSRQRVGFFENDIVLVYSGSSAGWQSLNIVDDFLLAQMQKNPNVKAVFLADINIDILKVNKMFPGRVQQRWLPPEQVYDFLTVCDYGLVIRERSVTNRVASPTKFAEYLLAGLPVIISDSIGDFSDFVRMHNCGLVADKNPEKLNLYKAGYKEKLRCSELSARTFTKAAFRDHYQQLINALKS